MSAMHFLSAEVKEKEGKKPLVFPCVSIAVEKIPVKLEAEGKYMYSFQ